MREELERFINRLKLEGKSEDTIRNYRNTIKRFLEFTEKIDEKSIEAFLLSLKNEGLSDRAIARHAHAIKAFLRVVKPELATKVPIPKFRQRIPPYLKQEELRELFKSARSMKEKLIIYLAYDCALRRSELAKIRIKDINFDEWTIKIKGKGDRERILPITKRETRNILKRYVENLPEGSIYLFEGKQGHTTPDTVGRIFKRIAKRAGMPNISFHVLRHSRAIHLLEKDIDIAYINKLLGHARLDTTSIYVVTHIEAQKLKKEIERKEEREEEEEEERKMKNEGGN